MLQQPRLEGWLGLRSDLSSHTGIVNVYNSDAALVHSTSTHMSPLKSLQNLVHPISTLRFDPSGQILAMASRQKDQFRLVGACPRFRLTFAHILLSGASAISNRIFQLANILNPTGNRHVRRFLRR